MVDQADDTHDQWLWGRALERVRRDLGLGQQQVADALGWTIQNVGLYERGKRPGILKKALRKKLTDALGVSPETLDKARAVIAGAATQAPTYGIEAPSRSFLHAEPAGVLLPIRDRAQAGAWLAADDHVQDWPRRYPAAKDPRYLHADQWLTEVVGDSVDQLRIYNGDFVHCVDFAGSGIHLRTGDIVEVERLRAGGSERELTIKQVEVSPNGILLWPRSSNVKWREPLEIRHGVSEAEEIEVRVRGVVLHAIRQIG